MDLSKIRYQNDCILCEDELIGYERKDLETAERIEVPEGVKKIRGSAFKGLKEIQELVLPESLRFVSLYAFDGIALGRVIFKDPTGWAQYGASEWAGQICKEVAPVQEMSDPDLCCKYLRRWGNSYVTYDELEKGE